MKTNLPIDFKTSADVEAFIKELAANGEFFHLDDDATDIVNGCTGEPLFTPAEGAAVNALMEKAFDICDVWELPIIDQLINDTYEAL